MEQPKLKPPLLVFRLEVKIAPTVWRPVEEVYHELSGKSYRFANRNEAATTKGQLKNYLKTHCPNSKAPIRICVVTQVAWGTESPSPP